MVALFALGSNGSGQLGIDHKNDVSSPEIAHIPLSGDDREILKIAAGGNHTLVLFSDGDLYTAGDGSDGRCLIGEAEFDNVTGNKSGRFRKSPLAGASLISATWEASTAVLDDGQVITSGTGNKGELGLGKSVLNSKDSQAIPGFPPPGTTVVDLAASMSHTVAVLSNGEVYGWGVGRKGQLGEPAENHWMPHRIDRVPFHACRVACGRDFTYIVGGPDEGRHIVFGSDKWSVISDAPKTVPSWKEIGASWGSIYVLLESGSLLSWGRNDHKQLCPPKLPKVQLLAVGSEHALALTEEGDRVIAWGWGEHGNCGPITDPSNVDFAGSEILISQNVVALGAGCATSWVVMASERISGQSGCSNDDSR